MATLNLDNSEIVRAVLQITGLGRSPTTALADAAVEADVRAIIRSGLRRFYFPMENGFTYQWRFLEDTFTRSAEDVFDDGTVEVAPDSAGCTVTLTGGTWPTDLTDYYIDVDGHVLFVTERTSGTVAVVEHTQLTVASGTTYEAKRFRYDLPTDFAEFLGDVVYANETKNWPLRAATQGELRLRYAVNYDLADDPSHYAIHGDKIWFWPPPEPDAKISATYLKVPDDNLPADLDTPGSTAQVDAIYAEALLEAILAAAEEYNDDLNGIHSQRFEAALRAAIQHDRMVGGPYHFALKSAGHERGHGNVLNTDYSDAT